MASPARELESKALKLSRKERARLAQRLISSLDKEVDAEKLWLEAVHFWCDAGPLIRDGYGHVLARLRP